MEVTQCVGGDRGRVESYVCVCVCVFGDENR